MQKVFEEKDFQIGIDLLTEPIPPMKTDPSDSTKQVLDKDGVPWVKYQFALKKYIKQEGQYQDNL